MNGKGKILVVDDNQGIRNALKILLPPFFGEVELISTPTVLVSALETFRPDVVLLDMNFHTDINTGNEGLYWTAQIKQISPRTEIVLFTAYADIALAVEGMRRGAFDFMVKPWDNDKLIETLGKAVDKALQASKADSGTHQATEIYWGDNEKMAIIRHNVERIAPTDATVLITGENGTGKDVLAGEIHRQSRRSGKPFVAVDAGAIPETLFESELFGHVKGAFTDAHADHAGKFEQADGGTLFLDEIGNIPLHLQAKLLRAIQSRTITRLGDTKERPVDIRLICATNMNLEKLVAEGRFRQDLYYRINTIHLNLPPLCDRSEDIEGFAEIFIRRFNEKYHRNVEGLSPKALQAMQEYSWKGNIRELQNVIEKAVILAEGSRIETLDMVPPQAQEAAGETLEMAEERAIRQALERYNGNMSLVAKALGVSRPTLYRKLEKYGL